jgi:pyruvate/2-oxoacid:ferredoxin oxidoreductase alpha subunit
MLDLTIRAFELSFFYRNPVIVLGDGYLGQMTGPVRLPAQLRKPGLPAWAVHGDRAHRHNLICSIHLAEDDLETHNRKLNTKYACISAREQLADCYRCDDADVLVVACNTPARMAKGAIEAARTQGIKAGLFRPITLWPFPIDALKALLPRINHLVVVEGSPGQLEDELRLALSHAGVTPPPISSVRHYGGVLPAQDEILACIRETQSGFSARGSSESSAVLQPAPRPAGTRKTRAKAPRYSKPPSPRKSDAVFPVGAKSPIREVLS